MLLHLPRMDGYGLEPRVKNGPALAGRGAEAVKDAIADTITALPEHLRRSLTWDRGTELAQHAQLRIDTGLKVYFADPHSPWQRGTNENTNGLLRQYFPKGTDLSRWDANELEAVALALNNRPLRFNRSEQRCWLRAVYVARLGRPGMSDEMKADLWRRWRSGESISVISRQIGKPPGSVFTVLKYHGGIAPAPRKARAGSLTLGEREEISRGLCAGHSYRAIARLLGRAVSTISREVGNNGGRDVYRAIAAQERALDRARRPKQCLLAARPALRQTVLTLLREEWSPEQIVGHLRRYHGTDPAMEISHETIHRSVYTTQWKVIPPRSLQTPSHRPPDPEEQATHGERAMALADHRCPAARGAPPGRGGPQRAWAPGRRSSHRLEQQPGRHTGRPEDAVPHGREARQPPHQRGRSSSGRDIHTHGLPTTRHADLGSRHGIGRPQASQH